MPISQGFWEWGCQKHRDDHITVTPPVSTLSFLGVYLSISQLPLSSLSYFLSFYSHGFHPLPPPPPRPRLLLYFLGTDMVPTAIGF